MKFYKPKGDSYAEKAVAILGEGPGEWVSSATLATLVGCDVTSIKKILEYAVLNDWIVVQKRGMKNFYSLGKSAPPLGAPKAIATMPPSSVFDLGSPERPMPAGASFGVWPDGRINIQRGGRITEQLSPAEARALVYAIQVRTPAGEPA